MAKKVFKSRIAGKKIKTPKKTRISQKKPRAKTIIAKPSVKTKKKIPKKNTQVKVTKKPAVKKSAAKTSPTKKIVQKVTSAVSHPKKSAAKKAVPIQPIEKTTIPAFQPVKLFVDADQLPLRYDVTRLALIARDPHWIYAYWEITSDSHTAVEKKIGPSFKKSRYVLRVHDVAKSPAGRLSKGPFFEMIIDPKQQNRYIELPGDNSTYFAELFVRSPSGKYFHLASSNLVSTPNAEASETKEQSWMQVEHSDGAKPRIVQTIPAVEYADSPSPPIVSPDTAFKISEPQPQVIEPLRDNELSRVAEETAQAAQTGFSAGPETINTAAVSFGKSLPPIGSSENLAGKRSFPLDVETELIVRGQTSPDAVVWLNSQLVDVTADGKFFLHFDLIDGEIPLHFHALSESAMETKTVETSVIRTPTISQ